MIRVRVKKKDFIKVENTYKMSIYHTQKEVIEVYKKSD